MLGQLEPQENTQLSHPADANESLYLPTMGYTVLLLAPAGSIQHSSVHNPQLDQPGIARDNLEITKTLFQGGNVFRQISTKLETNLGCVQFTPAPAKLGVWSFPCCAAPWFRDVFDGFGVDSLIVFRCTPPDLEVQR